MLLIIGFMLGVSTIGFAHLLIVLLQKVDKDQPFCKPCGFNRTGTEGDAPCPECGAAGEKKNIVFGQRIVNKRRARIAIALITVGVLVPLVQVELEQVT